MLLRWIETHITVTKLIVLLLAVIIGTGTLAGALVRFKKLEQSRMHVTGYAETRVKADTAEWRLTPEAYNASKPDAFTALNADVSRLRTLLINAGIEETAIVEGALNVMDVYKKNFNGVDTEERLGYRLSKMVTVRTSNIQAVQAAQKQVENLAGNGMSVSIDAPQYLYGKLDDLKLELIAKATKNARDRARTMVKVTGDHIGTMLDASSGVFQITTPNSTEVSDYGTYDTTTVDKKVTSVVNVTFAIQ
jgi:uncharacterized protein